jgi:hypothetical protein
LFFDYEYKGKGFVDTDKIFLGEFSFLPRNLTFVKRKGLLSQAILNIKLIILNSKGRLYITLHKKNDYEKHKNNHPDSKVVGYDILPSAVQIYCKDVAKYVYDITTLGKERLV